MFIGIDGTYEPFAKATYFVDFNNSFIKQLYRTCPERHKRYLEGPSWSGFEDIGIEQGVTAQIQEYVNKGDTKILLAGYSRGGSIAIVAARALTHLNWAKALSVECLALFYAVARDPYGGNAWSIPSTVANTYHARRSPNIGSRPRFGNCGMVAGGTTRFRQMICRATHAAMGGMPGTGDHPANVALMDSGVQVSMTTVHADPPPVPRITEAT